MDCCRGFNIVIIFLALSITSCKTDIEQVNKLAITQDANYDIAENAVIIQSENGQKRAVIKAPILKRWNESDARTEFPEGLKVVFYDSNRDSTILTADFGVNKEQTKQMTVTGNVVVLNYKNETLETEKLVWKEESKTMSTDTFIIIKTPEEILKGKGLDTDEKFLNYKIRKITGIINVED
jgi:LPS export ABC transporter protein LptC